MEIMIIIIRPVGEEKVDFTMFFFTNIVFLKHVKEKSSNIIREIILNRIKK